MMVDVDFCDQDNAPMTDKPDPASRGGDVISERAPDADTPALHAEIAALKARIAELEQKQAAAIARDIVDHPTGELDLRHSQELLQAIIDNSTAVIFVKDTEGRYLLINRRYEAVLHITRAAIRGKTDFDLLPAEVAEQVRTNDRAVIAAGTSIELEETVPGADGPRIYLSVKFPIYDMIGAIVGVCGIATDITDRKRAEEERAALQQQIIDTQQTWLTELSTPIIPLAEGVLAMPIVGSVDSKRAAQIMEALLEGIGAQKARTAILDITGVKVVDTEVANALIRAAQAAKLLGAEVILTGIGPAVAMSLITIGADLSSIVTLGTLRAGIAYALTR
jgi:rsbT co-antagonist protein RsbR